ncbi:MULTISPECIES: hypothetical protein [Streptomyces]|uniref:hypothetical protein n=1 Tax=Streptomyces TaxID=1883 RepID=UPI00210C28B6|nr:hypothetical protein [Streptomyces longispororuber]MCQ4214037.1 hypothetical protein [Streptomyces longispororuber]
MTHSKRLLRSAFGAVILAVAGLATAHTPAVAAGCNSGAGAPVQGPPGTVSAQAWSTGCENNWTFRAVLQSSRWYGWADDAEQTWIGSGSPTLSAGCAGVHDHRVILFWNSGPAQGQQISPVSNLNCG